MLKNSGKSRYRVPANVTESHLLTGTACAFLIRAAAPPRYSRRRNHAQAQRKSWKEGRENDAEFKRGKLKSGKPVKSKKQAIAIGLSRARKEGAKVPAKKS